MKTPASLLMRLRDPTEHAAWSRFVRLYTPLLYGWAKRLTLDGQEADDLVQDVFVVLIEKLPAFSYDSSKSFRGWLRTIFLNMWRRRERTVAVAATERARPENVLSRDPIGAHEETEYRNHVVGRALRLLKAEFEPTTWQACWEFAVRGRPVVEVAAELGVSVAAVYAARCRVLRQLRRELEGLLG
jgi:RNA polymerase sigma-70 factor (ECF subfamily)